MLPDLYSYEPLTYQPQCTPNSCGQSCVGIIVGRPAIEVIGAMGKRGLTTANDLRLGLSIYGKFGLETRRYSSGTDLPLLAIVKLIYGKSVGRVRRHWSVWDGIKGRFIDPSQGYLTNYRFLSGMKITSFMEVVDAPSPSTATTH